MTHEFLSLADGSFMLCGGGWRLELDQLRREHHELVGELTLIVPERDGQPEFRNTGSFNVSSVRARKDRAKYLSDLAGTSDFDYLALIEEICGRTLAADRAGQPAIMLRDAPRPTAEALVTVDGVALAREHTTIIFGDGGTAKSLLALKISSSLEAHGTRVLFADWELSAGEHRDRLERLCGDAMPAIRYKRCERPLIAEVDSLARIVRDNGIDYCVLDSIAPACEGPPEAAEVAAAFFRACRLLRVGTLAIAHVNKSESGDLKPFGSAFWHNLARLTWFVERAEEGVDRTRTTIALHCRKNNLGPKLPSVGLEFCFQPCESSGRAS